MEDVGKEPKTHCIIVPPEILAKLHIKTPILPNNDLKAESTNKACENVAKSQETLSKTTKSPLKQHSDQQTQRKRKLNNDSTTKALKNQELEDEPPEKLPKIDSFQNNNQEDTVTPKKRGRGRPKKSLVATPKEDQQEVINKPSSIIVSSQRGRRVKQINYSLLENSELIADGDNEITKEKSSESLIGEEKPKKRVGRPKKKLIKDPEEVIESNGDSERISSPSNTETSTNIPFNGDNVINNENKLHKDEEESIQIGRENKNDDSDKKNEENSRYNWTGNATRALNRMFRTLQGKDVTENEHNVEIGKLKRKGRPRLKPVEEEGSCICMGCNESIPNNNWMAHNSQQHYNLAWRQGEIPLPTNDEAFVLKTLHQLKKAKGRLKCNKCGEKIKKPQAFYDHLDVCNGVVNASGGVTCAICKTAMEKSAWTYHKYRQHNNLAWREGDPPLNLDDQDLIMRILTALYKAKKPLHCEKCDVMKKSVLGFLSHKTTCQKSAHELEILKATCELCGKKVLPVSMDYHLKGHSKIESSEDALNHSNYFDCKVEYGTKRNAAKQALQMISNLKDEGGDELNFYVSECDFQESFIQEHFEKQLAENSKLACLFPDCDLSMDSVETTLEHILSCDKKPMEYYVCKLCIFLCSDELNMLSHLKKEHNKTFKADLNFTADADQVYSEDEAIELDEKEKKMLRFKSKQKFLTNSTAKIKPMFLIYPIREFMNTFLYHQANIWMREFCDEHYGNPNIHNNLRNKKPWKLLDCELFMDYLPKNQISCDVTARILKQTQKDCQSENWDFKKMELFEVRDFYEGDKTVFCGGSVTALSWLPTPYNEENHEQILAVSVLNDTDATYQIDKNYNEPCLIQFWNAGKLADGERVEPYLMSCMAVNVGPIWHMEWCPSGCIDEALDGSRLGLVAVAGSDSFVYIYSIDRVDEKDRGLIYKGQSVIKLQLSNDSESLGKQQYYACKISWSKAAGHRYIAVGYTTGVVALFDLNTDSVLVKKEDNNDETTIFPYLCFQAHYSNITVITLNYLNGGNRWLCTGSFDRVLSYWDLHRKMKINSMKKNILTDGVWMTLWPCSIISEDETTMTNLISTHTYFKPLREAMTSTGPLTMGASGITALSFSDWLNTVLHCSSGGEIMAQFNHRFFYNVDSKLIKAKYIRCLFSKTKLVPKIEPMSTERTTYDDFVNKFGLVFLDYQLNKPENFPNSKKKHGSTDFSFSSPAVNEYCLQAINRVQFNPNLQSRTFYATGYHAGFVRLKQIKFLSLLKS